MSELQIFKSAEFGAVRTLVIDGTPYFLGKDVAAALGYTDVSHAVIDHVDEDDRINSQTQGQNVPEFGQRGTWLINESGVYALVFGSKLPSAKNSNTGSHQKCCRLFVNTACMRLMKSWRVRILRQQH